MQMKDTLKHFCVKVKNGSNGLEADVRNWDQQPKTSEQAKKIELGLNRKVAQKLKSY